MGNITDIEALPTCVGHGERACSIISKRMNREREHLPCIAALPKSVPQSMGIIKNNPSVNSGDLVETGVVASTDPNVT
jgi:hypothetical protein